MNQKFDIGSRVKIKDNPIDEEFIIFNRRPGNWYTIFPANESIGAHNEHLIRLISGNELFQ